MKNYLSILLIVMLSNIAHSDEFLDLQMKLAREGDMEAQFVLGFMYDNGDGVLENDKTAVMWYTKAAQKGYAPVQSILGVMYDSGEGVPENDIKAYVWYSISETNGNEEGKNNLKILEPQMTNDQMLKAQKLATKCYESNYKECDQTNQSLHPISYDQGIIGELVMKREEDKVPKELIYILAGALLGAASVNFILTNDLTDCEAVAEAVSAKNPDGLSPHETKIYGRLVDNLNYGEGPRKYTRAYSACLKIEGRYNSSTQDMVCVHNKDQSQPPNLNAYYLI